MAQRGLADQALEIEDLVGEPQRVAVLEVDLDLTREDLLATGPQVQLLTVDDLDPATLSQPPLAPLLALKLEPAPKAP